MNEYREKGKKCVQRGRQGTRACVALWVVVRNPFLFFLKKRKVLKSFKSKNLGF